MTNDTTTETVNEEHRCAAVPLVELLARVPETARHIYTEPDGLKATHFIPVGRYCREAAARIAELERDAARYRWFKRTYSASWLDAVTRADGVSWAPCWELRVYLPTSSEAELDAAIDSQREGK
jgi:hypothetical protein